MQVSLVNLNFSPSYSGLDFFFPSFSINQTPCLTSSDGPLAGQLKNNNSSTTIREKYMITHFRVVVILIHNIKNSSRVM